MARPKMSFTPHINPNKPILLEIGEHKYRFTPEGLSILQEVMDAVYSDMCSYMEHTLKLSPSTFMKTDIHYKCPYCDGKVGGISKNGMIALDITCPSCKMDLTSKFVDIMSQPYNGL